MSCKINTVLQSFVLRNPISMTILIHKFMTGLPMFVCITLSYKLLLLLTQQYWCYTLVGTNADHLCIIQLSKLLELTTNSPTK